MNSYELKEYLLEQGFTHETLLDELVQAMSNQEGIENFEHIAHMHDIQLKEEIIKDWRKKGDMI